MPTTETGATVEKSYRCAIQTRYNPNSGTISVWHYGHTGRKPQVAWQGCLDVADNHAHAVEFYLARMEWTGRWIIGSSPDQTGYVAVWGGE